MTTPDQNIDDLLKQALSEIRRLKKENAALKKNQNEPIAIVGMGCRFPGNCNNPRQYWELLRDGVDAIREVPPERWDVDSYFDPDGLTPGTTNTKWAGFLNGVDLFDPGFFGISVREAQAMDPQHRLLLEVAEESLEDAGMPAEKLAGSKTGIFVGICNAEYFKMLLNPPARGGTGIANSIAANRISYFYDFRGPSLVVDTACSSSLVAIDLACKSLRDGSSEMALAGGVNVVLSPEMTISFSQAGMMAPDGRCKSFDASGNGYVRGEGCGLLVLKRLDDAVRDNDRIYAAILASGANQDGRSNGLTAPNAPAQEALIRDVIGRSGIRASEVGYVEAHGTGTPLGDPVEFEALRPTYGAPRPDGEGCGVGSVKTNFGHLEAAAGIAGVMKAVLALVNEAVPPNLHFRQLNPYISLEGTPFVIPNVLLPWPRRHRPRHAAVSSFGFGGCNAHLILREADPARAASGNAERPAHILTLSARSQRALQTSRAQFVSYLRDNPQDRIEDICYSANSGRTHFAHRLAVVARSREELLAALESPSGGVQGVVTSEYRPKVAFVLHEKAYSPGDDNSAAFAAINSRVTTWRSWGVVPDVVAGVGLGEQVARALETASGTTRGASVESARAESAVSVDIGPDDDWDSILASLARLYVAGIDIDWRAFDRGYERRLLSLPTYPFERRRCWLDESELKSYRGVPSHAGRD